VNFHKERGEGEAARTTPYWTKVQYTVSPLFGKNNPSARKTDREVKENNEDSSDECRFYVAPGGLVLVAYGNVHHPEFGPQWQLRFQIQFLFPK